ncbi:von Willebrand factor type A [Trypanosoma rangeli]|uniref:von Willebrand factor type A n=1 Tax=Trypanosoma rangeli TaxID=5698 RepID=A0A3R7NP16_TRYRA|nr:von Willebrand factor type A [Trypanosoma rangeli]RNF09248.1 von Willebrand factor type A [Trypanosoma rangeli]|eukprot:RNF09248.1 von Willebrand factor type A [Trypanosoma rangeli]
MGVDLFHRAVDAFPLTMPDPLPTNLYGAVAYSLEASYQMPLTFNEKKKHVRHLLSPPTPLTPPLASQKQRPFIKLSTLQKKKKILPLWRLAFESVLIFAS